MFAQICANLSFFFFRKSCANLSFFASRKKVQKHATCAEMHNNTQLCTDAHNAPVHDSPASMLPSQGLPTKGLVSLLRSCSRAQTWLTIGHMRAAWRLLVATRLRSNRPHEVAICHVIAAVWSAARDGGSGDGGLSKSEDIWGKWLFFSCFLFWIFQVLFGHSGKWQQSQKKGENGWFRPISRKGCEAHLKPPLSPPFAAAHVAMMIRSMMYRLSEPKKSPMFLGTPRNPDN